MILRPVCGLGSPVGGIAVTRRIGILLETRPGPGRSAAVAAVALLSLLASSCHPSSPTREPGGRCNAPTVLPGSDPLPSQLQVAIAGAEIPAEAIRAGRDVCNRLALEPGAFARQHALDAIDWRPWSPAAFAEAAALKRPLFVLTGFAASAACEALGRAALSNRRLARDLNHSFVPVLVDREERPDVDAYLMLSVQALGGGAGWPAVVFLDSDARPFEAFSWGAAGPANKKLQRIVDEVRNRISLGSGSIGERAQRTAEKMQQYVAVDTSGPTPDAKAVMAALHDSAASAFDAGDAAFGPPPLFPRAPLLGSLLALHARNGDQAALAMATGVLTALRSSPLADPVGGGFHRYAKKAAWADPAYEKMLADNAALAVVYLDAAVATGRADFRDTARGIVDFLLRDLALPGGGLAASLSAVSPDEDGKPCDGCFYRDSDEVRRAALDSKEARDLALAERERRPRPARDERVLADANGLAISALVRAADVLGEPRYRTAAVAAADFVASRLVVDGRVLHCIHRDARLCSDGYLADQAFVGLAFLDLATGAEPGDTRWLEAARAIADAMPKRFAHDSSGGFFQTGRDAEPLPLRFKPTLDTAVSSGNSAAAMFYTRLAARDGDEHRAADAAVAASTCGAFSELLTLRPRTAPSMAMACSEASGLLP